MNKNLQVPISERGGWQSMYQFVRQVLLVVFIGVAASALASDASENGIAPSTSLLEAEAYQEAASEKSITGKVIDLFGDAIPGVSVILKGSTIGTITDISGQFTLMKIPGDGVLVFSFIGMKTLEVPIEEKAVLNVTLEDDVVGLGEVIAVGYSSKKKTELSSAVVNINSEKLQTSTNHDVATMLQGKVAGLQVLSTQQNAGQSANIRIRGSSSLSASSAPLWVVDGIIGGYFDPQDVEDITVLKDAGATGLYGSKAAGGVIVITTKKGVSGKTKVRVSSTNGIVKPNWGNLEFLEGPELYDLYKQGYLNAGKTEAEFLEMFPAEVRNVNFDWQDFMYGQGVVSSNTLSISGGTDKTTFYVSANFSDEDGVLKDDSYQRGSSTMNLTQEIHHKLSLKLNNFASYEKRENLTSFTVYNVPFDTPYDDEGVVRDQAWVRNNFYTIERLNHALPKSLGNFNNTYDVYLNPSFKLEYRPVDWMTLALSSRLNHRTSTVERFDAEGSQTTSLGGELRNRQREWNNVLSNGILKLYDRFGDHSVSILLGAEFNEARYKEFEAHGASFSGESTVLNAAAIPQDVSGYKNTTTFNSYFSQVDYNYRSKYFFTGSFRIDGSSKFGENNRYGSFGSGAVSWMISEEDFLGDFSWIDLFKLRASYGLVGNAGIDDYVHLNTFTLEANYLGQNALVPTSLGNPDLTWEVAKTFDFGIDANFLKNRVNVVFDYYYTQNSDLLFRVPLPAEVGYPEQWRNIGRLDNRGVELALNLVPVKTRDILWDITFQIGYNKDEIKELPGETVDEDGDGYYDNSIISDNKIVQVGGNRNMYYGAEWYGADPETGGPRWIAGYNDDGSPILTDNKNDARYITAKALPDYMGGFSSDFEYKGISLDAVFSFGFGDFTVPHDTEYDNDGLRTFRPELVLYEDDKRWEKPGDVASRPAFIYQNNNQGMTYSSRYWENGNYLKLSALSLGYSFDTEFVKRLGLETLKVFARGENLKVWHKSSTITPELAGFDSQMPSRSTKPTSTKIVFGIDLTF